MITAEYEGESDDEVCSALGAVADLQDGEGVLAQRRARDQRRAAQAAAEEDSLLGEITSEGTAQKEDTDVDILTRLGISRGCN